MVIFCVFVGFFFATNRASSSSSENSISLASLSSIIASLSLADDCHRLNVIRDVDELVLQFDIRA